MVSSASPFQSTRPLRGATYTEEIDKKVSAISIHAPLAGRDCAGWSTSARGRRFQSTRPLRGATEASTLARQSRRFQSTRPLRGATCGAPTPEEILHDISIHAPLAGRDPEAGTVTLFFYISIHAPLAGRDDSGGIGFKLIRNFNPRAPCGARRLMTSPRRSASSHFNPRAPCGARRPAA